MREVRPNVFVVPVDGTVRSCVVAYLQARGRARIDDIVREMGLNKRTVRKVVRALEEEGLVRRV
ncbi:TPA: MarR family transcriptional regulator, partial [Candidatus Micrarchaeota archaeon]|nr:MarR family transcriptional regulator [Candidatus Micrarchaeota archaeon]